MAERFLLINLHVFSLTVILFFASSMSLTEAIGASDNKFIRASCKATTYPPLCYKSLSNYASSIKTSRRLLAKTALKVTLDAAKNTSAFLSKLSGSNRTRPREVDPIRDCRELLSDAIDDLSKSITEMDQIKDRESFLIRMSNIQTWVSAAMTDGSTCTEGLAAIGGKTVNKNVRTIVTKKMEDLAEWISNALCLVNNYASHHYV